MESKYISSKLEEVWKDASFAWKDDYAAGYKKSVIDVITHEITMIEKLSAQIDSEINYVFNKIKKFDK